MKTTFFDIQDFEIEYLENNCPKEIKRTYIKKPLSSDIDFNEIEDTEIICCSINSICDENNLSKFKDLKCVITRSVGFNHIDLDYCTSKNIRVYNIPHYGDWTVAEYTFALMLTVSRNIIKASNDLKLGEVDMKDYMGFELHSKTIGIIGLGQIGERVAKIAKGFNMNILYYDIKEVEEYKKVSLETLLKSSDFITINCPLNEETRHLISNKELNLVKNGVVIINTARGEIVNTKALVEAFENNKISYLGLDVLECEYETTNYKNQSFCTNCIKDKCLKNYMLNQRLINSQNTIITPHIAYNTKEAVQRILESTIKNLEYFTKNNLKKIENNCVV